MSASRPGLRQLVDWSAALWAGAVAGALFLVLNLFVTPALTGGNGWIFIRMLGSIGLGDSVLAPPADFHGPALAVGLLVHFALSFGFALLLATALHRWGIIVGMLGGAVFGLCLYCINVYTMTLLFPALIMMDHPVFAATHAIFGLAVGGIYEALEVEEFEAVDPDLPDVAKGVI